MVVRTQARGELARTEIFKIIDREWQFMRAAPTIREIAAEVGLSVATVHRHVSILIARGRLKGKGRTLRPKET